MEHIAYNMEQRAWNIRGGKKPECTSSVPCSMLYASCSGGFSIIETIVAIAILSFAMVGPLSLAQRSLNASMYAKDQVTAFFLAQEAIEYVRYERDNNNLLGWSGGNCWLTGSDAFPACSPKIVGLRSCIDIDEISPPDQYCGIDILYDPRVVDCTSVSTLCRIYFNKNTGIYGLQNGSDWKPTIFTRKMKIVPVTVAGVPNNLNGEADITATVTWKSGFISRTMSVKEHIFNWFPIAP